MTAVLIAAAALGVLAGLVGFLAGERSRGLAVTCALTALGALGTTILFALMTLFGEAVGGWTFVGLILTPVAGVLIADARRGWAPRHAQRLARENENETEESA